MEAFDALLAWLAHPATIVTALVVAIVVAKSVRFVRDDQRMVVERLGRFSRIRGPGWRIVVPFFEKAVVLELEQFLLGWRGYGAAQLETTLLRKLYGLGAPAGLTSESMTLEGPFTNPMNAQGDKSLPEGMTIERKSGEIAIEIYDIPLRTPRLMLLWGTPLVILVIVPGILGYLFMSGQFRQPDRFVRDLPLVIGIFLIVVPILLYFTSSRGRNRTRITNRSGMIEVLYGPIPVPWRPRARTFRVDEIAQIDHVDEAGKSVVLRKISLVLRD